MIKLSIIAGLTAMTSLVSPAGKDCTGFGFQEVVYTFKQTGTMPPQVNESSSITHGSAKDLFYTNNDSGGKPVVYEIDKKGTLKDSIVIPDANNIDWEDLTRDGSGNLCIGDFGNNNNKRKNLRIYKYNPVSKTTDIVFFAYEDQESFPPLKGERDFDCEAFVWYKNNFYLFSKNRTSNPVKVYMVPDESGEQVAKKVAEIPLEGMITSAALNKDNTQLALLSYGRIYIFKSENQKEHLSLTPQYCTPFAMGIQSEGLEYLEGNKLLISNEQGDIIEAELSKPKDTGKTKTSSQKK
ncbi:hypothetical protein [Sporocytophaga myxococcoides]|nr:hypothetical protein [Sporocytophaga myxococcoides]